MPTPSLFRGRRHWNNKGFSSVIGALFMILVAGMLASAYFMYTLSQNSLYNDAVRQTSQQEVARSSEAIAALNTTYRMLASNLLSVKVQLQNIGPQASTLINLWAHVVENPGGSNLDAYNYQEVNITIGAGRTFEQEFNITITGLSPAGSYGFSAWFITSLGNTIVLKQVNTQEITVSQTTQGIGSLAMNFQDFRYYKVNTDRSLANYPNGSSGYVVSTGTGSAIAFKVVLTNLNYQTRGDIVLQSDSVFFSIFPTTIQQVRGSYWYIVNVDSNGLIADTYTNITLHYNEPKAVYFASAKPIKSTGDFAASTPQFTGTSPINLALIGSKDGQPFGQNIPFVSIFYS